MGAITTAHSTSPASPPLVKFPSSLSAADDNTEARVAAGQSKEDDPDTGDEETTDELEPVNASLAMSTKPKAKPQSQPLSAVEQMRAEAAAESRRIAGIRKLCGDKHPTIEADAIEQGWSITKTELAVLVMNKTMLAAYETHRSLPSICAAWPVTRLQGDQPLSTVGDRGFEQVAPDGELKHGKLSEQKYTNKADTYGQILMLTRHDIINDDLSAFMDIPRQMGRSGAEVIDHLFFTSAAVQPRRLLQRREQQLSTGADTAFGPDSLTVAKTTFRKQKAGPAVEAKRPQADQYSA